MSKVNYPQFNFGITGEAVSCSECPFADENGKYLTRAMIDLCLENDCPGIQTYSAACKLAEAAGVAQ